eukprot:3894113-Amphidinium_carterae.1
MQGMLADFTVCQELERLKVKVRSCGKKTVITSPPTSKKDLRQANAHSVNQDDDALSLAAMVVRMSAQR